jgi:hypothetical protein
MLGKTPVDPGLFDFTANVDIHKAYPETVELPVLYILPPFFQFLYNRFVNAVVTSPAPQCSGGQKTFHEQ